MTTFKEMAEGNSDDQRPEVAPREFYRALSDPKRRQTLYTISHAGAEHLSLDQLVDELSERTGLDQQRVTVSLLHRDLPILEDAGVIEFDRETNQIHCNTDRRISKLIQDAEEWDNRE